MFLLCKIYIYIDIYQTTGQSSGVQTIASTEGFVVLVSIVALESFEGLFCSWTCRKLLLFLFVFVSVVTVCFVLGGLFFVFVFLSPFFANARSKIRPGLMRYYH